MSDMVVVTFWVQVRGDRAYFNGPVNKARVDRMTANKPNVVGKDNVAVKLTLRLPQSMFDSPFPEAVVTVPDGFGITAPVEVEALDPSEEDGHDGKRNA